MLGRENHALHGGDLGAMEVIVGESPISGSLAGNLNDLEPADVA
jgi:hypothetical protein